MFEVSDTAVSRLLQGSYTSTRRVINKGSRCHKCKPVTDELKAYALRQSRDGTSRQTGDYTDQAHGDTAGFSACVLTGVAYACLEIADDEATARQYTAKGTW